VNSPWRHHSGDRIRERPGCLSILTMIGRTFLLRRPHERIARAKSAYHPELETLPPAITTVPGTLEWSSSSSLASLVIATLVLVTGASHNLRGSRPTTRSPDELRGWVPPAVSEIVQVLTVRSPLLEREASAKTAKTANARISKFSYLTSCAFLISALPTAADDVQWTANSPVDELLGASQIAHTM